jgi:hypothetical protein
MSGIETIERTVKETKDGWSVQLRFADNSDFEVARNAILIRADVADVSEALPLFREVLVVTLANARELINKEIQALRDEQSLKP